MVGSRSPRGTPRQPGVSFLKFSESLFELNCGVTERLERLRKITEISMALAPSCRLADEGTHKNFLNF